MSERWCEHRGCINTNAEPQFTGEVGARGSRQPKWFCERHAPLHVKTDAWGHVIRLARKGVKNATT